MTRHLLLLTIAQASTLVQESGNDDEWGVDAFAAVGQYLMQRSNEVAVTADADTSVVAQDLSSAHDDASRILEEARTIRQAAEDAARVMREEAQAVKQAAEENLERARAIRQAAEDAARLKAEQEARLAAEAQRARAIRQAAEDAAREQEALRVAEATRRDQAERRRQEGQQRRYRGGTRD